MSRTTKLELEQINARLAAENHELRRQLSESKVVYPSDNNNEHLDPTNREEPTTSSDEQCHEYNTFAEATARCKALVAWDTDRRYMFVQRGNKVVCKIRAAH